MLTPVDVKGHIFKAGMGGNYNSKEVNEFLDLVSGDYETLYKENEDLKQKITELNEGVQYYKNMESTLQKALVHAQMDSEKIIAEATAEAENITNEANAKAEATISEANQKAEATVSEANTQAESLLASSQADSEAMLKEATEKSASLTKEAEEKHTTLISEAEAKSQAMLKDATEKSDKMIKDATAETDNMLKTKNEELKGLNEQIEKIQGCFDEYKSKFIEVLNLQLKSVENGDYDVKVDGLSDALKTSKETVENNDALLRTKSDDNVERINAFDGEDEELDKDGLNTSGLNFDIDRSADSGITIDDFEPAPLQDTTDETSAPLTEEVIAEANSNVEAPQVENQDAPVEDINIGNEAPQFMEENMNNPSGSDFGFVSNENANGYEMPEDMQDEFDAPVEEIVEQVEVPENNLNEAPDDNQATDGGFTFIDA